MLLLEIKNVAKYVGNRCLFKLDDLKVYSKDKIGVVGANGAGKTMLLQVMSRKMQPDEGKVTLHRPCSYITQLAEDIPQEVVINPLIAQELRIAVQYSETMSGGEKTRYKIAAALSEGNQLLLADEPTANLDIQGIEILQQKLLEYDGAIVVVTHDRALLESVCKTIWEVKDGKIRVYKGNFRDYLAQKEIEWKQKENEYKNFRCEKAKLEAAIADRKQRALSMRKTPKRMGNSEARLHKMGNQKAQANLSKALKVMETRLQKLEVKERPRQAPVAVFGLANGVGLYSKVVIQGQQVNKCFGKRILFENAQFSILNGQKVALVGENGCGKTTLLTMIAEREGIYVAPGARLGYFSQAMEELDLNKSALHNVMAASIYDEGFVRGLLAQLLFRREEVFKPAGVLSGGERVRIALAKIIAGEANVLILDEPTNYLDLPSLLALESVLAEYQGTMLFASHDREFINAIATHLMLFENNKITIFTGNYQEYLEQQKGKKDLKSKEEKLLIEHRLAEVLSKLSVAKDKESIEQLDKEYRELLRSLR